MTPTQTATPAQTTTMALVVNGEERVVAFPTHHTLLEVLREECGLTGTKHGCELGECGTCTVLIDGRPILSCLALAAEMEGRRIETVEGLALGNELHPLQRTFADLGAAQCGYCTPGILMAAKALLEANPSANEAEVKEALAGNLCRCTGYHKILQAVAWAGAILRGDPDAEPDREWLYGSDVGAALADAPQARPELASAPAGEQASCSPTTERPSSSVDG